MPYLLPDTTDPSRIGVCVQVPDDPNHIRAFLGALYELTKSRNWGRDAAHTAATVSRVWTEIYDDVSEKIGVEVCEEASINCRTYLNTSPFIQYFPNDPRYTPDLVPEGYVFPPWYFATAASNLAFGTSDGDIVTSLDRFPPGSLPDILPASGLPRCRVNVNVGAGAVVRVYIRNMFAGSMVQTTVDDDLLTLQFHDVLRDVVSVPPETSPQVVFEWQFEEAGLHHIDLIVVSTVNDQIPFIFHGAAIMRVEICGEESEVPVLTDIQIVDCELQVKLDNQPEWQTVGRVQTPEPACDFDNPVTIHRQDNGSGRYLILEGGLGENPANDGGWILWNLNTGFGLQEAVRVVGQWHDDSVPQGEINLDVFDHGLSAWRSLARVNYGPRAMHIFSFEDMAHVAGLTVQHVTGDKMSGAPILEAISASEVMWQAQGRGRIRHWTHNPVPTFTILSEEHNVRAVGVTPAAGFGSEQHYNAATSASASRPMGKYQWLWVDAFDAERRARWNVYCSDWIGSQLVLSGSSNAGQAEIAVLGAVPQPRQIINGQDTDAAVSQLLAALDGFGWIDNQASVGAPSYVTDALGDRNRPPNSTDNQCKSANYLAEALRDYIALAYSAVITPFTIENVYTHFQKEHGWWVYSLYVWCENLVTHQATASDTVDDLDAHMDDMVLALSSVNAYDQTAVATAFAGIAWNETYTAAMLANLVYAFSVPKWKEYIWYGGIFGSETYPCSPCAGGSPEFGDWAIEWGSPNGDWSQFPSGCGTVWEFEAVCGGRDWNIGAKFDVLSAGTVQWEWLQFTVEYHAQSTGPTSEITCSLSNGSTSRIGPEQTMEDGTHTLTFTIPNLSSGTPFQSGNGGHLEIRAGVTTTDIYAGDYMRITSIRIEGTLEKPAHNGQEC